MASLSVIAEQYFSTLNPLAEKISSDVEEVRVAYDTVWDSLTEREKTEIINESLIKTDLALRYTAVDPLDFDLNDPPFIRQDLMSVFGRDHGRRLVQDDGGSYKDEHSGPFLYQTKSQLNLCELSGSRYKEDEKAATAPLSDLALSHSKVVSELKNALKSHDVLKKRESPQEEETSPSGGGFISKIISKKIRGRGEERERLVSPEPTPVIVAVETMRSAVSPRSVPKSDWCEESRGLLASRDSSQSPLGSSHTLTADVRSGFDFLDNW